VSRAEGPWVSCPHCGDTVLLSAFVEADDEPGVLVAVCRSCARYLVAQPPAHPSGG